MSDAFDPYHKWLAIPADEQPPNHYRLLGVHLFEEDADVIDSAADRQMGHVRRFATGQRSELSQKILNEISSAKVTLLNPEKRAAYDADLRKKLAANQAVSKPLPTAQALPTGQSLPKAQAIPMAAQSASPQLRTRTQASQPVSSGGMDIPIVDQPKSVAQRRKKKKSSPVLTLIALIAVAGALIGAVVTALNRPVHERDKAVANTNERQPAVNPPQKVIVRPDPIQPATDESATSQETDSEETDTNAGGMRNGGGLRTPGSGARIPGSGGGRGVPGSGGGRGVPGSGGGQPRLVQGQPVNLLSTLDLEKAVIQGRGWTHEDGILQVGEGTNSRIEMPLPAEEYVLYVTLERLEGNGQFYLGLPVKGGSIGCSVDMVHKQPAGQFAAGFYDGDGNALMQKVDGQRLLPGRTANIACMVHNERLLLHVNGQFIGFYARDDRPLALNPAWAGNLDRMLIVGAASSTFKITKLEYRPYTRYEPGSGTIAGTGTGNSGTTGPDTDTIVGAFGERLPTDDGGPSGSENSDEAMAGSGSPSTGGTFDNFGEKKDPPAEDKQAETLAVLQDLFPDEFAAAKTTAGKLALGQKLYDTAQKTQDDPAALYVLLDQAAHYAAEGGNAEVPMRALTELDRKYNVDIITLYVETFDKALKGARAPAEHESLIQQVKQAIAAAQAEDRYEDAEKLMRMAQSSARVTKDADVIKEVAASAKQLRDAQSEFDKVSDAKEKLETDPDDPEANTQWGKYLCVVKNDFPQGMPLLAKGSDAGLKAAAETDLAMPRDSKEQIAAGDKWFALADASSGLEETMFRIRAGHWYQKGALGLTGLEKTRIDKRLSDISKISRDGIPQPTAPQPSTSRPATTPSSTGEAAGRLSMIGRGMIEGKEMGVTLTYQLGQTIDGRAVRQALNRVGVDANAGVEINLAGNLLLREPKEIKFRVAGGSSSGGVCYLTVNRREVAAVGDDRNKDTTVTQMLPAGVYLIGLRITGGDLGSCLLECTDAESGEEIGLRTELLMAGIRNLPTLATINLGKLSE